MRSNRVCILPTSQDSPCYIYHTKHKHAAGTGSVVTSLKMPMTMHVDGFPTENYVVSVTPSQPAIVSVSNQTRHGFDVTLTAIDGGPLTEGTISVLGIG